MIFEQRTYRMKPRQAARYLELMERHGLSLYEPAIAGMLGYFYTDVGKLNTITSLWQYGSFEEREIQKEQVAQRGRLPQFAPVVAEMAELCDVMESQLLLPASFSPIR